MIVNKYILIGLHLLVTYQAVKTFMILSANVEDVKRIAKEFSGPLTDEIVGLILKATQNYTFNASNENEGRSFKSNLNLPIKLKYKNIIRNKQEPIQSANYYTDDINVKKTPKYSYYMAPKIHNYAEVKTEAQRIYGTSKRYNVLSLSNHIPPPQVMKKISLETLEPEKNDNDNLESDPKNSSLNEPNKYQNDHQKQIATPQVPIISDNHKIYNNVDPNYIVQSELPQNTSKDLEQQKIQHDNDLNNIDIEIKTTKKRDTSTKLIELYSDSNEDTNFHQTKSSSKRKKKSKTMQTEQVTNKETTEKTSVEAEVTIKMKTKKYKSVPVTTSTATHNDDTTVDLELQKFEKEVSGYLTSTTSEGASQKITENTHSPQKSDKHKHSKRHKKHNRKHERTKGMTLNLVRLVEKVERLDQVAQKIMSSTTTTRTTTSTTTTKKISTTRPTPAYPKQEDYKIPNSEFKLSYDPNQEQDVQDYNHMYARYFKRNQMIKEPENNVQETNTIGKLSEVIQKIIQTRLDSKLSATILPEHSSRRQHISSRSAELRNIRGLLTNSEEEAMFKIIKAMIDSKKINELKSSKYVKEQKRSTIKAFNIQKMSPEEDMADVIHKMVDSSLRMQFEKPQMSVNDLAETLKNKYYENHIASGNKKVSEMIEKIIEKKIQEYAQTTKNTAHSKRYQKETRPKHHRKDKTWPSVRPSYKNIARIQTTTKYTSPTTRYQSRTRKTKVKEVLKGREGRIGFQIPYAEYPRTSKTTTKLADETFGTELSTNRYQNQHTSPLPAPGSAIKISHGRQGPISIVIEDKESEEIKRPSPQAFLLQKPQTTQMIDPHIIVVDNRHIDPPSTKGSFWEKELKTKLIKKILRERETTKKIDTPTTRYRHIRSDDGKQVNDGDSDNNRIPNFQLVFLNVPKLEAKENEKQILRKEHETTEEKRKEEREEQENRRVEEKKREEERRKEERRREQENKIKEERKQHEEKIQEEEKRRDQERLEEQRKREEEKKKEYEEEKRKGEEIRREQMRREEEKRKEEERRQEREKRIVEERIEEERKRREENRKDEDKRKEIERLKNEKKALRQEIEKEIEVTENLDRKWENDLENKIKEKQKADVIADLKEADRKRKEAANKILDHALLLMQDKIVKDLESALKLKDKNETQTTQPTKSIISSTTLNYWEQQWQKDQEEKLKEEYNKYMKLHNAGPGLSEKTINYWNEQWRVDLEKKIREKQKEEQKQTKITHNNKWLNFESSTFYNNVEKVHTGRESALLEMVRNMHGRPITNEFEDTTEDQENLQIETNKPVHYNWRPRNKQKRIDRGISMLKNINIRPSDKSKTNRFDARRDDDYSDTIYIMPDGRKRDKLVIKRVHDRSKRVTATENMSEEHTERNYHINTDDDAIKLATNEHIDKKHRKNKQDDDIIEEDINKRTNEKHHKNKYDVHKSSKNKRTRKKHNKNKYDNDVIKSDTILKANKINWRKPERTESKKVTAFRVKTEEQTEKNDDNNKSSENEVKIENDKTESEEINVNILRTNKADKPKSKHKKNKKYERKGEEKKESKLQTKKRKNNKDNTKDKHEKNKKNKTQKEIKIKSAKKVERKNKNDSKEAPKNSGSLSKENEKFENDHKETTKVVRNIKHRKKVKAGNEEDDKTEQRKYKIKHKKKKKKENIKIHSDNEEELKRELKNDSENKEKEVRMDKKKNSKDDQYERDQENKEQLKERKTKHKKREKATTNIEETSHRIVEIKKEKETHEDDSIEKDAAHEKEDKSAKNKKRNKGESHQKNQKNIQRNSNKNDDDGGRQFDFQLMIGENDK